MIVNEISFGTLLANGTYTDMRGQLQRQVILGAANIIRLDLVV